MALKTLVKVSEVNNLSDARYCAGMGVELVGFPLDENHPKFIELSSIREIVNWISGVKVVGEFSGDNIYNMNYLAEQLALDYIQLNHLIHPEFLPGLKKPVILKITFNHENPSETLEVLDKYANKVAYFLLESNSEPELTPLKDVLGEICQNYPVILGFGIRQSSLPLITDTISPAGIALKGGEEIKPGLKDFSELSDILEELEVND
jgi:phosphoribosylanthranilate isomerase